MEKTIDLPTDCLTVMVETMGEFRLDTEQLSDVAVQIEPSRLNVVVAALADFLSLNPSSSIVMSPENICTVHKPWGEAELAIKVPEDADELFDALNNIVLPSRYTAIWHRDTQELEVIFSAYTMRGDFSDLKGRNFNFHFDGNVYSCGFLPSSERLIAVAQNMLPVGQSPTNWRNLWSYQDYARNKKSDRSESFDPISFWIKGVDIAQEDKTLDLITNLNFFMTCYDTSTPRVLIHSTSPASSKPARPIRYPTGEFPPDILGRQIDDILLQFWAASLRGDPIRRFLYNYQIIEYAAVYYVDDDVKRAIRKLLKAPDALSNIDRITDTMIDTLSPLKMHQIQKTAALLKQCVSCEVVWTEIQQWKDYFESRVSFDGGYVVEPLIVSNMRQVTFANNWSTTFENAIRHVRNGLSHGKEFSTAGVIAPTIANQDKIQPWLGPLSIAARNVMLYRGIL